MQVAALAQAEAALRQAQPRNARSAYEIFAGEMLKCVPTSTQRQQKGVHGEGLLQRRVLRLPARGSSAFMLLAGSTRPTSR